MNMPLIKIFTLLGVLACTACLARADSKCEGPVSDLAASTAMPVDTNPVDKAIQLKLYIQAIEDYIEAVQQKDHIRLDTLFLSNRQMGSPDDFPDIRLPAQIAGVGIVLLPQDEVYTGHADQYRQTAPLINLVGWIDGKGAEFIFVTFFPAFTHQFDGYIQYTYDVSRQDYQRAGVTLEVLVRDAKGNPDHLAVYQDGKYIGDKEVNK